MHGTLVAGNVIALRKRNLRHIVVVVLFSISLILISAKDSIIFKQSAVPVVDVLTFLKSSGFFTYRQVWHSKTLRGAHIALMCFVQISEQTATCFFNSISRLVLYNRAVAYPRGGFNKFS